MLDQIEQWEDAAEQWADENVRNGKFKCDCGKWADFDSAQTIDPNPYARPVCNDCFEEAYNEIKKNREEDD